MIKLLSIPLLIFSLSAHADNSPYMSFESPVRMSALYEEPVKYDGDKQFQYDELEGLPELITVDEWTDDDTRREAVYIALHIMDWAQTRTIARNPDRWNEVNPILGEHPSVGRVDAYFAVMALSHMAVSDVLPTEYRDTWQYLSIGFEAGFVGHNLSLGIGVWF